jgi:hypothetical protein
MSKHRKEHFPDDTCEVDAVPRRGGIVPPTKARHRAFIPGDYVAYNDGSVFQVRNHPLSVNRLATKLGITLVSSAHTDTEAGW